MVWMREMLKALVPKFDVKSLFKLSKSFLWIRYFAKSIKSSGRFQWFTTSSLRRKLSTSM